MGVRSSVVDQEQESDLSASLAEENTDQVGYYLIESRG